MKKMTKVQLGREMAARGIIGKASIYTPSSLRWDAEKKEWTGKIGYGREALGRFTKEQMVASLQAGRLVM